MMCFNAVALQNIRIDCALSKEFYVGQFCSFFVKHFDKFAADNFSFLFGLSYAFEKVKESVSCINIYEVSIQLILENFNYFFDILIYDL